MSAKKVRDARVAFDQQSRNTFLEVYAKVGNISAAAEAAGVTAGTAKNARDSDEEFREQVEEALEQFRSRLEEEGLRRAVEGIEEPVFQQGRQVGEKRVYSDHLLKMYLQANIPKYRERLSVDVRADMGVLVVPGIMTSQKKWLSYFSEMELEAPESVKSLPTLDNDEE